MNRFSPKRTMVRFLTVILVSILLVGTVSASHVFAQDGSGTPPAPPDGGNPPNGAPPDGMGAPPDGMGGDPSGASGSTANPVLTSACGIYLLDGEDGSSITDVAFDSTEGDVSAICVMNGGTLTLVNPTITKTGDTSSDEYSSFYGLNAGVLVGSGSVVNITGGTVTTDGQGTNGVFATGAGALVTLTDVTIYAVGDGAHAVMATLGGEMVLVNVDMVTTDTHSGAVATDRGSGTITVTGGTIEAQGADSPGIYSTGLITVTDAIVLSTGAEAAVIEGANSIILTDTSLTSTYADKWGVMLYQSMSGDAEGTEGVFTMTGGDLSYTAENGPLFFNTNATAIITLSGVEVNAASGILVQAGATERWGTSGANGGHVQFTADAQTLAGDFVADSISDLDISLLNGSSLTGAINAEDSAASANVTLDATSTWNVTADSHLTCLTLDDISTDSIDTIVGNGYTVTYNADACPALGGATYALANGGTLQPA